MSSYSNVTDAWSQHPGFWRLHKYEGDAVYKWCFERQEPTPQYQILCIVLCAGEYCVCSYHMKGRAGQGRRSVDMTIRFRAIWLAKRWRMIARRRKNARIALTCLCLKFPKVPFEILATICHCLCVPDVVRNADDQSQCNNDARMSRES